MHRSADRQRPSGMVGPRRAVAVSGSQVRQRLRRHGDGRRDHRDPGEPGQPIHDRALVGGGALSGHRQRQHSREPRAARANVYANLAELAPEHTGFDTTLTAPLAREPLPSYPPGPVCNVRGLTPLGEYVITRMIDKGMIIETDHFSVRARAQALAILESRGYPDAITSHSWGDETSRRRIQALGGFVAPYANTTKEFIAEWQEARGTRSGSFVWGIGFGTDTNGLGKQAAPRPDAVSNNPVTYPFLSFDGSATIHHSQWGTRSWDFNLAGASHYGLFVDWIEDMKHVAGPEIVEDLARGS